MLNLWLGVADADGSWVRPKGSDGPSAGRVAARKLPLPGAPRDGSNRASWIRYAKMRPLMTVTMMPAIMFRGDRGLLASRAGALVFADACCCGGVVTSGCARVDEVGALLALSRCRFLRNAPPTTVAAAPPVPAAIFRQSRVFGILFDSEAGTKPGRCCSMRSSNFEV